MDGENAETGPVGEPKLQIRRPAADGLGLRTLGSPQAVGWSGKSTLGAARGLDVSGCLRHGQNRRQGA
jgi:hypothetical protein